MKLVATMPVRNEAWCLGLSLRVALLWCDSVCLLLHECSDGSADIVEQVIRENDRGRVIVTRESGEWDEMQHRQELLDMARRNGATHIAITDADEILTGNVDPLVLRSDRVMVELPLYNLRDSLKRYHSNGIWSDRWASMVFQDHPNFSWNYPEGYHHREPMGISSMPYDFSHHKPIQQGQGGVMHLWGASDRRLRAKSAWYKMDERLRRPRPIIDQMYSWAIKDRPEVYSVTPDTWTFADVPESWWAPYQPLMKHLDIDAEPWQEAACRKMLAQHGIDRFDGLDLFGVV